MMALNLSIANPGNRVSSTTFTLPILRKGDQGEMVMQLQQLLNQRGANLILDGDFGVATETAVIRFQRQQSLVPDGIVATQTWSALQQTPLIRLVDVCRYYNPATFPYQRTSLDWLQHQIDSSVFLEFLRRWNNQAELILRQGDRGPAVNEAQRLLNRKGALLLVDGIFGAATRAAVMQFQQQNGLIADGVVSAATWRELRKPNQAVLLSVLFRSYNPSLYPYQTTAVEWLQAQLSPALLTEFAKRWRNQVV